MMHNITNEIDREQAQKDAENESKRADLKQHVDKLIRGFENIDGTSANRAIWELVQNACDLSSECIITIDYSKEGISFTHNGKPFTTATLISLIKQVSNKVDDSEVGKFGTGFITTHAFGRKFKINSLLELKGRFINVKDFLVDRSPKEWFGMVENLLDQEEQVYDLIQSGEIVQSPECLTTFTYFPESPTEQDYIKQSFTNLYDYIPLVLTLNEKLISVTVIDENGNTQSYRKHNKVQQNHGFITTISINNDLKEVYSLKNETNEIEVILPLTKDNEAFSFPNSTAKLFLYYPLIGSELWGCNFIIHSTKFAPTEPRDGIHLKSKTDQVKELEESNRALIQKASEMIFEFVRINAAQISSPMNLAMINFNVNSDKPLLDEYFQGLKKLWINEFKNFPLVDTEAGNIKPSESLFIHEELLQDENSFDAVFKLANKFWKNIPKKHLIKHWTKIIDEWNIESIKYIGIKDIIIQIQQESNLTAFDDLAVLKQFYAYLIENEHSDFFNSYKLLPNIKGEFRQLVNLNNNLNLSEELISIADIIMPDIPKKHVHPDFKFNLEFADYSRKNFTTDINDQIAKQIGEKATSGTIQEKYLHKLVDYCKIASSADSASVPSKIVKLICRYYNLNEDLLALPAIKDDELDNRPSQKRLLRLFLNDLSGMESTWVIENIGFLEDIISTGASYEAYEDMFLTLPIFPNQLNELRAQGYLSIDDAIPTDIKKIYDKVVKPNTPINSDLVHFTFGRYLKNQKKSTTRSLTEKIESVFSEDGQYTSISTHPFRNEIMEIISRISSNSEWSLYFPSLSSKRANIMLDRVTDEKIKSDVFSIVSLEADKINKLGTLAKNPNLDQIINLGMSALEEINRANTDFDFKKKIGVHIEDLIRNKIKKEVEGLSIKINEEQGGQDIVIKLNEESVYFIEVKSRWDIRSSITMSNLQIKNAVKNKHRYSLCCVDLSDYFPANGSRYEVKDIIEILDRVKFVNDIGERIAPLISNAIMAEMKEDDVRLTDEYRALVPQAIVQTGMILDSFVNHLIEQLALQK